MTVHSPTEECVQETFQSLVSSLSLVILICVLSPKLDCKALQDKNFILPAHCIILDSFKAYIPVVRKSETEEQE